MVPPVTMSPDAWDESPYFSPVPIQYSSGFSETRAMRISDRVESRVSPTFVTESSSNQSMFNAMSKDDSPGSNVRALS